MSCARRRRDVDFRTVSIVEELLKADWPLLGIEIEIQRHYPYGESTAHLLGYMGIIQDENLKNSPGKTYMAGDFIGKTGQRVDVVAIKSARAVVKTIVRRAREHIPLRRLHARVKVHRVEHVARAPVSIQSHAASSRAPLERHRTVNHHKSRVRRRGALAARATVTPRVARRATKIVRRAPQS